ncbi:MAG: YciI family protein [Actinomycetota bacterium]|nr:YciI family protein [Actinomycetota bacterium]
MPDAKTIALVQRGPGWRDDLLIREQSEIGGHLTFMVGLVQNGLLEAAGPFFQTPEEHLDRDLVGLVIFADADPETARRLLEDDPARAAGTVDYEVLPWYR